MKLGQKMIKKLDNSQQDVAWQIYTVFQASYAVEAQLIGTKNFPPLLRCAKDILNSKADFYAVSEQTNLAAIFEITIEDKLLYHSA